MSRTGDSVFDEPHMRRAGPCWRCGYDRAGLTERDPCPECGAGMYATDKDDAARVDHSVWDEAGLSVTAQSGTGRSSETYGAWVRARRAETSWGLSFAATIGVAMLAGPWAVLGALLSASLDEGSSISSVVGMVFIGPAVEEIMKVALLAYVVERRAYLLKSGGQVLVCAFAGGVVFAAIENLMYLRVYIDNPSPALVAWRWSVCVALHGACSLIAGGGLLRVWSRIWSTGRRPELLAAFPFTLAAITLHGVYNATAILLEVNGRTF